MFFFFYFFFYQEQGIESMHFGQVQCFNLSDVLEIPNSEADAIFPRQNGLYSNKDILRSI